MTSIVAWLAPYGNDGEDAVWICADSRLSSKDSNDPLIDEAPKILPLAIQCWHDLQRTYYQHKVGFAYAGSSLIGLNGYATLTSLCHSLLGSNEAMVPSLGDIAQLASDVFTKLIGSHYDNRGGAIAAFECCLFGHCHTTGSLRLFHFQLAFDIETRRPQMQVCEADIKDAPHWRIVVLGTDPDYVLHCITEKRVECGRIGPDWHNAPLDVLHELVDDVDYPEIGGSVQAGVANAGGLRIFGTMRSPAGIPSYVGSPVGGRVGPCFLSMAVMGTKPPS